MQSVLIVSATLTECQGLLKPDFKYLIGESHYSDVFADFKADLLITGVGSVATTFYLTKLLSSTKYELLINIGLAGSFNESLELGMVVGVKYDQFADLGAEDHDDFIDIFDIGLLNPFDKPFKNGKLLPVLHSTIPKIKLQFVDAITVNKVHGEKVSIEKTKAKFPVDIESMEGAAFFYVAGMFETPSLQIRAISNFVEPRNRENWEIELALTNLKREINLLMCSFTLDNFL